jgi:hypothetical protein
MTSLEIRQKAREIIQEFPHGIRAGELYDRVGEENFNAVLKELFRLAELKAEHNCNCPYCDEQ